MPKGEKGSGRPYPRGSIWWVRYTVPGEGQRKESSGSTDKNDALRLLNQRRKEIDDRLVTSSNATVSDLLDLYLADQKRQGRSAYQSSDGYVRLHLAPAFGKIKADRLTSQMIERFIDQKHKAGYANASINRYLEALGRAYTLGRDALPPVVNVTPKIVQLPENNVREGFLEHPQYVSMLNALPDHQKLLLVIGYHLGMRLGEILQLRWEQIDWDANLIRLEKKQTKGKQARVAPMYGELRGWLDMAFTAKEPDCPYLISWNGQAITEVKTAWKTARVRAGLPALLVHDLRRTAVRNMVRSGISEKRAMLISGHKSRSMFDRYDIVNERDIQDDGRKLAAYHRKLAEKVRPKVRPIAEKDKPAKTAKGLSIQ